MSRLIRNSSLATLSGIALSTAVWADDLADSGEFLCTGWSATTCTTEGECNVTEAWRLGMPDFVTVDLQVGKLVTPEASDEQRESDFDVERRDEGLILLHGVQGDRAWSWVIKESSGEGTMTISSQSSSVTVFTVCTPTESL